MLSRPPWPTVALAWLLLLACREAPGQQGGRAADSEANQGETPARAVEEVGPEVIHLWDGQKKLIAVPGFTLEEFHELYKLKNQLEQPEVQPRYTIEQVAIQGVASGEQADLQVSIRIVLHQSGLVKIPLRLGQSVLRDVPKHEGTGKHFFHAEEAAGYVAWIRAEADSDHVLTFDAVLPLVTTGGETRLEITTPRATVSQLLLNVPGENIEVSGKGMSAPTIRRLDDGGSEISALGLVGQCALTWHEAAVAENRTPLLLAANAKVLSTLDGRSTQSDATVSVRSFGGQFKRFRVKLPPGAQLIGGQAPGYALTPIPASGEVDVELETATSGPIEVRLRTEQAYDVTRRDQWVELAGFEVVDALRQGGQIAVAVVGDWKIDWGQRARARQIDEWAETFQSKDIVAVYELLGQSSSLKVRAVPRIATTYVEPEFVCLIDPGQARLTAKFKYQIRGGKVFSLPIDVQDWEVEDVGPATVVDRGWTMEGTILSLPLVQATTGEVELTLRARRSIQAPGETLSVAMPQPRADVINPANLLVSPANNVLLEPLPEQMVGLNRQPTPVGSAIADRQQPPLAYWADAAQATFAARYQVLQQQVAVRATSSVTVEPEQARVAQRLEFQVAHEALQTIELRVPQEIVSRPGLKVQLDGQPIEPDIGSASATAPGKLVRLQIAPTKPRIGRFELSLDYAVPLSGLAPETTASLLVPLAMPGGATILSNEVSVQAADGIRVESRGGGVWKQLSAPDKSTKSASLRLSSEGAAGEISLAAQLDPGSTGKSTIVRRALIQTWLNESSRQDRAAFRISSAEKLLRVTLPRGVQIETLEVLLDGQPAAVRSEPDNVLAIEMLSAGSQERLLEIRYFLADRGSQGRFRLELPTFEQGAWIQRTYWELILPRSEHLISADRMNPEFQWRWDNSHWGRIPALAPYELASWIGLSEGPATSTLANRYLFSTIGRKGEFTVWTVSRSLIVFLSSFGTLIVGLFLIYVPAARHPASLLVMAIVLAASCFLYPGPVLLVAQAATLGIALAVIAAVLHRMTLRRHRGSKVVHSSPSSIIDRASTEFYERSSGAAPVSTATVPIAMDIAATQSKS